MVKIKKPRLFHPSQQTDSNSIDPTICPLCNKSNYCGNASACTTSEGCWCSDPTIQFPEALLEKVPNATRNKACICKACALKHKSAYE